MDRHAGIKHARAFCMQPVYACMTVAGAETEEKQKQLLSLPLYLSSFSPTLLSVAASCIYTTPFCLPTYTLSPS